MECLVRTQVQSQGMASLTAEDGMVSKIELGRAEQAQTQTLEDCDDLGLCLLRSQPIQEEVHVGGRESGTVEVFTKGPLGNLVDIRDW